jgi:hypothetical protein
MTAIVLRGHYRPSQAIADGTHHVHETENYFA